MSNNTATIIGVFDPVTESFQGSINIMGEKLSFVDNINEEDNPIMDELGEKYLSQFDDLQKFEVVITIKPI